VKPADNSPGSDESPAELIQAGGEILLSENHKLINSIWNKEELSDQWKKSIIVSVHKKGDKSDCNNYRGISLLSTSYKTLSEILFSRLRQYIEEICRSSVWVSTNRSTTDEIFCIRQILRMNGNTMRQYETAIQSLQESL
jgi:hypothetical protein